MDPVSLRLPRWDTHAAERLHRAGIGVVDAPDRYVGTGVEVRLEAESRDDVVRALRGWTVLLPSDFTRAA
jgi:hypothetical protein